MKSVVMALLVFVSALYVGHTHAEVPRVLQYHGFLTNASGDPVDCPSRDECNDEQVDLRFSLYGEDAGGIAFWTELHQAVPVFEGNVDVLLGSIAPLSPEAFYDPIYLGVSINGGTELVPRQRAASVPFALQAQDASTLNGIPASEYATVGVLRDLCVLDTEVAEVLAEQGVITADELADYLLEHGGFSGVSCDEGDTLRWTENHWSCSPMTGLTEADVLSIADAQGFARLSDIPTAVLSKLGLDDSGNLTFEGQTIVGSDGSWVGTPLIGLVGPQGPMGPQGGEGPKGETGTSGMVGPVGPQGPRGEQGIAGGTGPIGPPGVRGDQGTSGDQGPIGPPGMAGPAGASGTPGSPGVAGDTGPQGVSGPSGPKGDRGEPGAKGDRGDPGAKGEAGDQGSRGDPGIVGPPGPPGSLEPDSLGVVSNELLVNRFTETFACDGPVLVPDNYPGGVIDEVSIPSLGPVRRITVSVNIENPAIDGLELVLFDPENNPVVLLDRTSEVSPFIATFPTDREFVSGSFDHWLGVDPFGVWRLAATDWHANGGDGGRVVQWSLTIEYLSAHKVAATEDFAVAGSLQTTNLNVLGTANIGMRLLAHSTVTTLQVGRLDCENCVKEVVVLERQFEPNEIRQILDVRTDLPIRWYGDSGVTPEVRIKVLVDTNATSRLLARTMTDNTGSWKVGFEPGVSAFAVFPTPEQMIAGFNLKVVLTARYKGVNMFLDDLGGSVTVLGY